LEVGYDRSAAIRRQNSLASTAQARKTLRRQFRENYDAKKIGNTETSGAPTRRICSGGG
jgi:hypothetical protein